MEFSSQTNSHIETQGSVIRNVSDTVRNRSLENEDLTIYCDSHIDPHSDKYGGSNISTSHTQADINTNTHSNVKVTISGSVLHHTKNTSSILSQTSYDQQVKRLVGAVNSYKCQNMCSHVPCSCYNIEFPVLENQKLSCADSVKYKNTSGDYVINKKFTLSESQISNSGCSYSTIVKNTFIHSEVSTTNTSLNVSVTGDLRQTDHANVEYDRVNIIHLTGPPGHTNTQYDRVNIIHLTGPPVHTNTHPGLSSPSDHIQANYDHCSFDAHNPRTDDTSKQSLINEIVRLKRHSEIETPSTLDVNYYNNKTKSVKHHKTIVTSNNPEEDIIPLSECPKIPIRHPWCSTTKRIRAHNQTSDKIIDKINVKTSNRFECLKEKYNIN